MKFKDFTDEEIVKALKQCSNPKGQRCSSCPIFGKGFQGQCTTLLMKRAAEIIESGAVPNEDFRKEDICSNGFTF